MSGRKSKRAGTSFEYRVAKWFENKEGWNGLRNPLSGASEQIEDSVGRHDVRAWNDRGDIFLQIEAKKKTGQGDKTDQIKVKRAWTDKVDYYRDEILVFATNRSPMYVFLPVKRFFQLLGRSYKVTYNLKNQWFKGEKELTFHKSFIEEAPDKRFHLLWGPDREEWIGFTLEEFVMLRETASIEDELSLEDQIKRITTLENAKEFEKIHLPDLNYKQKRMLYAKFEQIESGSIINPLAHAQDQFWLDDAFILNCPHCGETVTKKDLDS